ncbi:MAG: hypothetical protein IT177_09680 [Acidobacteria bacterium]|nr:hypothetical protein [Acidobacteriota bacterium]
MITIDSALTTLDAARDTCPDPLDCVTERQRIAAQQRLRRIDSLRHELTAAQHAHGVAAERLAALEREAVPVADRLRQIAASLAELGEVDGHDHSPEGTARWRLRERLQHEQAQHAAYQRALDGRRAELTAREQDAHARLTQCLRAIAALEV